MKEYVDLLNNFLWYESVPIKDKKLLEKLIIKLDGIPDTGWRKHCEQQED